MITAGCDIGSLTSKGVIMENGRIKATAVIASTSNPQSSAEKVMNLAVEKAGMAMDDIDVCVGTGYGRDRIPFVQDTASEIVCHGTGARWLVPGAMTVIDIGGQDCKVIRLSADGQVEKFITNDKCASGTGRFLEVMARVLGVSLDELGTFSAGTMSPITFASTCTVWAQADVIRHLNDGHPLEDIGAGINSAMANRVSMLVSGSKPKPEICMTGGVSKNRGVVQTLEKLLGSRIHLPRRADPQLAGAIGAALLAQKNGRGGAN